MENSIQHYDGAPSNLAAGVFGTAQAFELAQRQGTMLSKSTLIPKQFSGNVADCVLAVEMASRLGASPLAVLQNIYIVHGKPSWSSSFLIAMINTSGRFSPLQFEMTGAGEDQQCVAHATVLASGERVDSPPVSIKMAKAEGWFQKNGSKWQTMPELMLRYRAATMFARLYASDLALGMKTQEEVYDIEGTEPRNVTKTPTPKGKQDAIEALAPKPEEKEQPTEPASPKKQEPKKEKPAKQPTKDELLDQIRGKIESEDISEVQLEGYLRSIGILSTTGTLASIKVEVVRSLSADIDRICNKIKKGGE